MNEFDNQPERKDIVRTPEHDLLAELLTETAKVAGTYYDMLADQADAIREIGSRSRGHLDDTLREIGELEDRIKEWSQDPASLSLVDFRTGVSKRGTSVSLRLREPEGEVVPKSVQDALFQIDVRCTFAPEDGPNFTEELVSRAYEQTGRYKTNSGDTGSIVARAYGNAATEAEVRVGAQYVYVHPRTEDIKYENGPAIAARLVVGGEVSCQGVSYVGVTPHHSEQIPHTGINRSMLEKLRDKLLGTDTQTELTRRARQENAKRRI